jgi:hypothetical protein
MKTVEKKTWKPFFDEIFSGEKTFDIRLGNSKIRVGDVILFREYDPEKEEYTGRKIHKKVSYQLKQKGSEFGDEKLEFWSLEKIQEHGVVTFALEPYLEEDLEEDEKFFDHIVQEIKTLRIKKNADYGSSWKKMRSIGLTDMISIKIDRVKSFENKGVLNFESIEDSFKDSINYCLFALRKLQQAKKDVAKSNNKNQS